MAGEIAVSFAYGQIPNNFNKNRSSLNLAKNLAQIYISHFEFFEKDFSRKDAPHPFDVDATDRLADLFFLSTDNPLIDSLIDLYNAFYEDPLFIKYTYDEMGRYLRDYKKKFKNPQKLKELSQTTVNFFIKHKDLLKKQEVQIKDFMMGRTFSLIPNFKEDSENLLDLEYKILDAFTNSKYNNIGLDLEEAETDTMYWEFLKRELPNHKFCYFIYLIHKKSHGTEEFLRDQKALSFLKSEECDSIEEIIELCNLKIPGYSLKKRLGIGTYKKVYLGRNIISDVLKAVSIFDVSERGKVNMDKKGLSLLNMIKNETKRAEDLKNIGNPNIAKIDEVSYNEKAKNYILITELMEKTLQDELDEKGSILSEKQVLRYLPQIVEGLDAMHKRGMLHSDITLRNIGIKGDTLKLIDFGLTSTISEFNKKEVNTGSIDTRAPELFGGKKATTQSDIWSLGSIMYKMLAGEYLFSPDMEKPKEPGEERGTYEKKVYNLIKSKDIEESLKNLKISKQTKEIIKKCLERNPRKRIKNASKLKSMLDIK